MEKKSVGPNWNYKVNASAVGCWIHVTINPLLKQHENSFNLALLWYWH